MTNLENESIFSAFRDNPISMPTQIRVEAAFACLKMGEARLLKLNTDDVRVEAILDKDGIVILDFDY